MTREEALQILDTIPTIGEQVDALEMAIKALEQEPCEDFAVGVDCTGRFVKASEVFREPCEDFLSREERLKMLMETGEFDFLKDIPPDKIWKLVFMLEFIGDAESEEKHIADKRGEQMEEDIQFHCKDCDYYNQSRPKGEWIETTVRGSMSLVCSECGADLGSICETNYCPTCGAKMESEDKE